MINPWNSGGSTLNLPSPKNLIMNKPMKPYKYPLTEQEDKKVDELYAKLERIRVAEEQTKRELRTLIYKIEKQRA